MMLLIPFFPLFFSLVTALVELPMRARGGALHAKLQRETNLQDEKNGIVRNSTPNFFDQLVWHNDTSKGTFKQRFYYDTSSWNGDKAAPILVYIGGEGPLGGTAGGYPAYLAKQHSAFQLALEHRYYGDSFPSSLLDTATLETLKVDTALEDLAVFIRTKKSELGLTGKVIVIGGSYPGALSSWFRQKYPEVADISWSSSGVVSAVYNFTAFDKQVLEDVSNECGAALHAVTAAFEDAWVDTGKRPALLNLFGTPDYFTKEGGCFVFYTLYLKASFSPHPPPSPSN